MQAEVFRAWQEAVRLRRMEDDRVEECMQHLQHGCAARVMTALHTLTCRRLQHRQAQVNRMCCLLGLGTAPSCMPQESTTLMALQILVGSASSSFLSHPHPWIERQNVGSGQILELH